MGSSPRGFIVLLLSVPLQVHAGVGYVQSGCTEPDAGTSLTVILPHPTTAGDVLVVAADYKYASVISVADPTGDPFTPLVADQSRGYGTQGWYALDIDGGADSVTVTFSSLANNAGIFAAEYASLEPAAGIAEYPTSGAGGPAQTYLFPVAAGDQQPVLIAFGSTNGPRVSQIDPPFVGRENCFGDVLGDVIAATPGSYQGTFEPPFDAGGWEAFLLEFRIYGRWVEAGTDAGPDSGASDAGNVGSGADAGVAANLGCSCRASSGFGEAAVLAAALVAVALRRRRV